MSGADHGLLTIIVTGRNDDYGGDFRERLFRTALHNAALFQAAGVRFEYVLAEWNPLPDRPSLSEEFVARVPDARALIVPPEVHREYTLNPQMPFHEMAAKNAALRRAAGSFVIVTNADILFSESLVCRIAAGGFSRNTLYRAHRIDVKPELNWAEIQDPSNQLSSGEGRLPPPVYLGAGGDFCLASRDLWFTLRGFNERIRFSTRAKDWQFFLSARAQGVPIAFIGDVYHLDHEGGFRNTGASELGDAHVHFGRWWDIEFALPFVNDEDWGFAGLREHPPVNDARIAVLQAKDYVVTEERNRCDREVMAWLTRPLGAAEKDAALLLHAICVAHRQCRRLIFRIGDDPRLAVTLAGFDAVASRFAVEIFCNWNWPEVPGYSVRRFEPEPRCLRDSDWIVARIDGVLCIHEYGSERDVEALPGVLPVLEPEFNPVLSRRLLYAVLQLQVRRAKRIAILGGGGHTRSLLQWGLPDAIELAAVIDSRVLDAGERPDVDAILLSSASFESDMLETCRRCEIGNVIALYSHWPHDMWEAAACPA